ncbi:MAG: beta-propeller domain-containing protein, partial [Methanobacteriota archaeon]
YVGVYDVADAASPTLLRTHGVSGYLVTARMVAPYAYVIVNDYVQKVDDAYLTPRLCLDATCGSLPPTEIYYDPGSMTSGSYTNVLAVDLEAGASTVLSVVTGYASTVYMSTAALYLSFLKWTEPSPLLLAPQVVTTWTTVHKVRVAGLAMEAVASGDVSGWLLNQFSMDEYAGYLRVATTSSVQSVERFEQRNNVYVLDGSMRLVGRLEGLAPRESIYAARFLGERLYLVTFEKIDPLFVIDLSDPADPRVLGYLEMPGFSEYLHPFDEARLIGVGKEAVPDEVGNFSWFQGLKLSLFDVGDVAQPEELARIAIGDRGTTSDALTDHKAFLFLRERGIVVIPVSLALLDPNDWEDPLPPWAYGETVWIGAYVLRVGLASGFEVVGRITHIEGPLDPYTGWDYLRAIGRSFAIGDVLYTVSGSFVKANALADLAEVGGLAY